VIAVEDLTIRNMTRSARGTVEAPGRNVGAKAGLNCEILAVGWGQLRDMLVYKAARAAWLMVYITAVANPSSERFGNTLHVRTWILPHWRLGNAWDVHATAGGMP
jgi:putative transposase